MPEVFPACAGMFLKHNPSGLSAKSFPRMRGDVPEPSVTSTDVLGFSPHARGCSGFIHVLLP